MVKGNTSPMSCETRAAVPRPVISPSTNALTAMLPMLHLSTQRCHEAGRPSVQNVELNASKLFALVRLTMITITQEPINADAKLKYTLLGVLASCLRGTCKRSREIRLSSAPARSSFCCESDRSVKTHLNPSSDSRCSLAVLVSMNAAAFASQCSPKSA